MVKEELKKQLDYYNSTLLYLYSHEKSGEILDRYYDSYYLKKYVDIKDYLERELSIRKEQIEIITNLRDELSKELEQEVWINERIL